MNTVDKTYTIKYSKAGIYQYADFLYKDDILAHNSFYPSWTKKEEVPLLDGINNINEILKIIKKFAYNNNAEIYKINRVFPEYYNNKTIKDDLENLSNKFNFFINELSESFFTNQILPVLKRNRWKISNSWTGYPILIKKIKKWDNVDSQHKDYKLIDYMAHRFLSDVMSINEDIEDKGEMGYYKSDNFAIFLKYISEDFLNKNKIFIKI